MNMGVCSDESDVFDKSIFRESNEDREKWSRKYSAVEKVIRGTENIPKGCEVKAATVSNLDSSRIIILI